MTTPDEDGFAIGVALDGVGWHPAAWRSAPGADPAQLFQAAWWLDQVRRAAAAGLDFVTLEDGLSLQADSFGSAERTADRVRGRLDPVVLAAAVLATTPIGEVVVTRNVTHSNPFQVAAQLASLAALAPGRVVWRPQVSSDSGDSAVVGSAPTPAVQPSDIYIPARIASRLRSLFADAADFVATVRALWETYPAAALGHDGCFVNMEHVVPLVVPGNARFRAAGPLTVPVLQAPPVAVLAHHAVEPYRLALAAADRVFVTPTAAVTLTDIHDALATLTALEPHPRALGIYVDVAVVLGATTEAAHARLAELNAMAGSSWTPDTIVLTGSASDVAQVIIDWRERHGIKGIRLRPAGPAEFGRIADDVVPTLRAGLGPSGG